MLSDSKLKSAVLSAESAVREQLRAAARCREALAAAPSACSVLAAEVTAAAADAGVLAGQLAEVEQVVRAYLQAGRDQPLDPLALQVRDWAKVRAAAGSGSGDRVCCRARVRVQRCRACSSSVRGVRAKSPGTRTRPVRVLCERRARCWRCGRS